jgi:hypothetical protein
VSADQVKAALLMALLLVYALLIETVSYVLRWRFARVWDTALLGDPRQR